MNARTIVLALIVLAIAALAALNWATLATPAAVSLGFMVIEAPLGLLMLGLTVLMGAFFLIYIFFMQGTLLLETRRHTKELQAQRELADRAEASRFTELRGFLEVQQNEEARQAGDHRAALVARIDALERDLLARAEQTDNVMAAHMGQLEDRLERRPIGAIGGVA